MSSRYQAPYAVICIVCINNAFVCKEEGKDLVRNVPGSILVGYGF